MQIFQPLHRGRSSNITRDIAMASPRLPPHFARCFISHHGSLMRCGRKARSSRRGSASSASSSSTTTPTSVEDSRREYGGTPASFSFSSSSASSSPSPLRSATMRNSKTAKLSSLSSHGARSVSSQVRKSNSCASGFAVRRPRTSRGKPRSNLTAALSEDKCSGHCEKKALVRKSRKADLGDVQFLPLCCWFEEEHGAWRGPRNQQWTPFAPVSGDSVIATSGAFAAPGSAIVLNVAEGVLCGPIVSSSSSSSEEDEVMSFMDSCQINGDPSLSSLSCLLACSSASTTQDRRNEEDHGEPVVLSGEAESPKGNGDVLEATEELGEEEDYRIDLSDFKPDVAESDEKCGLSSKGGGGLCLTLDFHEVLSAWQDRGCLWAGGRRPSKLAHLDQAFPYLATIYDTSHPRRPFLKGT